MDTVTIHNPILNNPYLYPKYHWRLGSNGRITEERLEGRRPSAPYLSVPLPEHGSGMSDESADSDSEPFKRINRIRERVALWREGGYDGVDRTTLELLEHWHGLTQDEMRPFFCQLDAVETLIWLCEAVPRSHDPEGQSILHEIGAINKEWNDSVERLAIKMATGTGKTLVMAMIILWLAMRSRERTDVLILTPNLTVRERLQELDPIPSDNVRQGPHLNRAKLYRALLPRHMTMPANLHVTVINFQAFRRQSKLAIDGAGDTPSSRVMSLLRARSRNEPTGWREDDTEMLDRVLSRHRRAEKITVINDEAHHCRYHANTAYESSDKEEEKADKADSEEAAAWFRILTALQNSGRLGRVFDLSATPMYRKRPVELENNVFPWTMSDYSLIDAVEAGMVKIPTVPIEDNAVGNGHDGPIYRNIYENLSKSQQKLRHDAMPTVIVEILEQMEKHYTDTDEAYSKNGVMPVMIIVANNVKNANAFYRHISGYVESRNGKEVWHHGRYPTFTNVKMDGSGPVESPPTLLVHSEIDDGDINTWDGINKLQKAFFAPKGEPTKRELVEYVRRTFNTVGKTGEPGEHVRCIISVSMLTEGWDAHTVTHVFGFRPFGSQLLCEQVAGRSLRRTSRVAGVDGIPVPEYASIVGVPFRFMPSGKPPPPETTAAWPVRTVKGREKYRITFPNIDSCKFELSKITCKLVSKKVKRYRLDRAVTPTWTEMRGIMGDKIRLETKHRTNQVIYQIAEKATRMFLDRKSKDGLAVEGFERRRLLFASMAVAVKEWIRIQDIKREEIGMLVHDPHLETVPKKIAEACIAHDAKPRIVPVFIDERDPDQPHLLDTSDVNFDTSLKYRYPAGRGNTAHSELSAAACHTKPEKLLAEVLDKHPDVLAWARNFRLGWRIPYFDQRRGRWRGYVPDFVARLSDDQNGSRHLIIEFKGAMTDDALDKKEGIERMWIPAVNDSNDPACAGTWAYVIFDPSDDGAGMKNEIASQARRVWKGDRLK